MRSIAMAAFQGMPHIGMQIDSILKQMAPDDELIISDNGSTDGTREYLESMQLGDGRIRLYQLDEPKGVVPNFQNALEHCRGEIILLSDQDDFWINDKLETMSRAFGENPKLIAIQTDAELMDSEGRIVSASYFALRNCGAGIWKNFIKNTWQGCNMAFRSDILALVLPFPKKIPMHDMWIGILSELCGDVKFIPVKLAGYRRHSDNASEMKRASWGTVVRWRFILAFEIIKKLPSIYRIRRRLRHDA